jgi:hypothetical protein
MHKTEQNLQPTQHDSYTLEARSEPITTASEHINPSEYVKCLALFSRRSHPLLFSKFHCRKGRAHWLRSYHWNSRERPLPPWVWRD